MNSKARREFYQTQSSGTAAACVKHDLGYVIEAFSLSRVCLANSPSIPSRNDFKA